MLGRLILMSSSKSSLSVSHKSICWWYNVGKRACCLTSQTRALCSIHGQTAHQPWANKKQRVPPVPLQKRYASLNTAELNCVMQPNATLLGPTEALGAALVNQLDAVSSEFPNMIKNDPFIACGQLKADTVDSQPTLFSDKGLMQSYLQCRETVQELPWPEKSTLILASVFMESPDYILLRNLMPCIEQFLNDNETFSNTDVVGFLEVVRASAYLFSPALSASVSSKLIHLATSCEVLNNATNITHWVEAVAKVKLLVFFL